MRVVGFNRSFDCSQVHGAVGALVERLWLDRAQHRHATGFPAIGVGHLPNNDFVATFAMRHQAEQIGLRAANTI